jgi:CubicO group peptidase (beta-lactamase class C family)
VIVDPFLRDHQWQKSFHQGMLAASVRLPIGRHEMFHFRYGILLCLALCMFGTAAAFDRAAAPSDSDIHQILVNRIDKEKQGVGIVVGVIDAKGRRVVSYGTLEKGDKRPLDGDTLFEIGSITKVFTSLLLADMSQRGEVRLDDPIAKYVPGTAKIPQRNGRQITLVDLATHTSGLPRMPANFNPKDPANPYIDYTDDLLYAFLSSYELTRDIGVKFVYSNLGFGLLGQGLARRNGTDYETLVETRICGPLGMKSTRITLTPELEQRFAAGHSADLVTVSRWDLTSLAGAGALRSSTNDMLKFLAAAMGYSHTSLTPAFKMMLSVKRPTGQPFLDSALGWVVDTRGGGEIIWKNGGTGGYRTFIGYSPRTGVGIVALSNASTAAGTDDIGLHLLDARFPLDVPEGSPRETAVGAKTLDGYLGRYKLGQTSVVTITREGDQLYAELTGQPRAALYANGEREFFFKIVDAQITFQADPQGETTALVLHQGGRDQTAKRISDAEAKQLEDALAKRVKDQTAASGSEAATRKLVEQMQRKQVDYEQFTPDFAVLARQYATITNGLIAGLGALQSLNFKGVGPGGADIYEIKFDGGVIDWRILMAPDGKVAGVGIRKMP